MIDYGAKETDELYAKMEKRLNKVYRDANADMNRKLKKFMREYEADNKAKRKDLKAGKISETEYNNWLKSKAFQKKQLEEMVNTLAEDYTKTDLKAMGIVRGYMPEAYAINRNFGAFQVEKGSKLDTSFTLYDSHTVQRIVRDRPNLLPDPKPDIPKEMRWHKQKINHAITQGILQGESVSDVAKRLQAVTDMDDRAALRNARTALTAAQNAGRMDSYKDAQKLGIELKKEWLASLDGRTRDSHRDLDGVQVEVDKTFPNGCEYPGDPTGDPAEVYNCRCTLVPAIAGIDQSNAPRNSKLGDMSYEEWKKGKGGKDKYYKDVAQEIKKKIIANAKAFSPAEHTQTNFSPTFWATQSKAERDAVKTYTGSTYVQMNKFLRDGVGEKRIENLCNNCEKLLDKTSIAEDTLLYRGMGRRRTLSRALDVSKEELETMIADRTLIGQTFVEKGFCSTGVTPGAGWDKNVVLEIVAPKGTKGLYVDPISMHMGEKELLLQRNTTFEIFDFEDSGTTLKLKVLITEQKP